jgi:hypothetical protein
MIITGACESRLGRDLILGVFGERQALTVFIAAGENNIKFRRQIIQK